MAFVLDASIAVCWAMADENDARAENAFRRIRLERAFVPGVWWFGVRNILLVNERRKRISSIQSTQFLADLACFSIVPDLAPDERQVLRLARDHGLTVYDAAYLELALRREVELATLDGDLAKAARSEGVGLV